MSGPIGAGFRVRRHRDQRGLALVSVMMILLVLVILSALILYLSGKEVGLSAVRLLGAQSLNAAEGGAYSARAALMALMSADPAGIVVVDQAAGARLGAWFAGGNASAQNAFGLLDYLILDGQSLSVGATPATDWVILQVDWSLAQHLKLRVAQTGTGTPPDPLRVGSPPANPVGPGRYSAAVVLTRRQAPGPSCTPSPTCYIHQLQPDGQLEGYEYFYTYTITSDGSVGPRARRRVTLSSEFSIIVQRLSFARYALFTHVHNLPTGGAIWFTSRTSFNGPVHTNGEFRFAFFPKFGAPDAQVPCDQARVQSTPLTSVSTTAWFNNYGNPVRLAGTENVVRGVRRDAPVLPDCTPANVADDNDNLPASFTLGFDADLSTPGRDPIIVPQNSFSQAGIAIGRNPTDTSAVTDRQIRQAVPELTDCAPPPAPCAGVPNGIYVPVEDTNGNGISDAGEALAGGIYVLGNLSSLTLQANVPANDQMTYRFVQGGQTVTVAVDRAAQTTSVTNTAWPNPQSRLFRGVPKGWQGPGNGNATLIYVAGDVLALSGTLEEREQTTIAASGRIDITNHLRYEDPPDPADPTDNPVNVLGLFSQSQDIRIALTAPDDLVLHAVMMAGTPGPNDPDPRYNASVTAVNYSSRRIQGQVHVLGGIIEEYYGAFGTFDGTTGAPRTGYGRDFAYDTRMSRGLSPPYFPTTTLFTLVEGSVPPGGPLTNVRPTWREGTP